MVLCYVDQYNHAKLPLLAPQSGAHRRGAYRDFLSGGMFDWSDTWICSILQQPKWAHEEAIIRVWPWSPLPPFTPLQPFSPTTAWARWTHTHTHNLYLDNYQVTASLTHLWSVLCSANITIKRWLPLWPTWSRWRSLFVRQQSQQPLDRQSKSILMYRVIFFHWYPPKSSKYRKVNLCKVICI